MNGLAGDGLDGGGRNFAGDGIDAGENGHEHGEQVDCIEADLEDGTEGLVPNEWRDAVEMRVAYLEVHPSAEESEEGGSGEEGGPKDLSTSRFAKGDASDGPELSHRP